MLFMGRTRERILFGQGVRGRAVFVPTAAQLRMSHRELGHAAVEDRRGGADVAGRVSELPELPEEPPVSRQPQRQLLRQRDRIRRDFLVRGSEPDVEEVIESLSVAWFIAAEPDEAQ